MRKVKKTSPGIWLVWDEPLPMGHTYASGAAVYQWKAGNWSCDKCRTPIDSTKAHCDHINFVQKEGREEG